MSVQRPYNILVNGNNINGTTIDASLVNNITWSNSGDISVKYDVQIYNNANNVLAYDSGVVNSYSLSYALPANALLNGYTYKITITVYNVSNSSAVSYAQIFNTSKTPVVTVSTIDNPVTNSNYTFDATYSQEQNVAMASYIVYLYDNNRELIAQSNAQTTTPIEYTFQGLQSTKSYYVEFQITSNVGLTGTSGLVAFNVNFSAPIVNTTLTATANDDQGSVLLSWNVVQIIGTTDIVGSVNYIGNEKVDLTSGKHIWFQNGFSVDQNFTCKIWLASPVHNKDLITFTGSNGTIRLQYQDDHKFHLYKDISNSGRTMHIRSKECAKYYFLNSTQTLASSASTNYYIYLQQIGNLMEVFAQVTG